MGARVWFVILCVALFVGAWAGSLAVGTQPVEAQTKTNSEAETALKLLKAFYVVQQEAIGLYLWALGYSSVPPGPIDGKVDTEMETAIRAFQTDNELPSTGLPSTREGWDALSKITIKYARQDAGASFRLCVRLDQKFGQNRAVGWCRSAAKHYRQPAERGDVQAQSTLGFAYAVIENNEKAARWYQLAAKEGDGVAQLNLGIFYRYGLGVPQDFLLAHMWLNLAAAKLPPGDSRKKAVRARNELSQALLITGKLLEAQRMAREWLKRHRTEGQQ